MITRERGFTLIELLVVIAIIGVLSSVVLSSLNSARGKGNDAKVEAQLSSLRGSAEIYYGTHGDYGAAETGTSGCTGGMFTDPVTASGMISYVTATNYPSGVGATISCNSDGTLYKVFAKLPFDGGNGGYWCVDSLGSSKREDAKPDDTATPCL